MSRSSATRSAASSTRSRRRCPCPSWATSRSTACSSGPRSSSRSGPTSTSWRGSMTAGSWRIGMFSLFRLPLVAFRPHDLLLVYETDRRVAGLVRVERESWRDDWTFVELDAIGARDSGEIRYRLVQQVLREGQKRGAARFHVACADADDNVELFMQAGFARYGEERILYRPPDAELPQAWPDPAARKARIRSARPVDANALMSLYNAVTPQPVQRLEAFRIPDWERQGSNWRVPRSSLAPILRFADLDAYVLEGADGNRIDGFIQIGVAREDQPHYLRLLGRPEVELADLIRFGLGEIA